MLVGARDDKYWLNISGTVNKAFPPQRWGSLIVKFTLLEITEIIV